LKSYFRSVICFALLAISTFAFGATADIFKPDGVYTPGITAVQTSSTHDYVARAVAETAVVAAVHADAKLSMRQERERSLTVGAAPAADLRPMAFRKSNGEGFIRSGQSIQADRGAKVRQSHFMVI
jgi:hypothetical protein